MIRWDIIRELANATNYAIPSDFEDSINLTGIPDSAVGISFCVVKRCRAMSHVGAAERRCRANTSAAFGVAVRATARCNSVGKFVDAGAALAAPEPVGAPLAGQLTSDRTSLFLSS